MHQRLQPRMLLFFFTLSFFICMPSHPLFVNPDRIQDENSKKRIPTRSNWHRRYRLSTTRRDDSIVIFYVSSLAKLRSMEYIRSIFSYVYSVPCFFQTSRHTTRRKSNMDRKYVLQFNEFPRAGETYRYIRARDWVWTGRSSWISTNKSLHWWNGVLCRASTG